MKVLIADDDPLTVAAYSSLLRNKGHEVVECTDGIEVLHLIEEHRPTAVFLDLSMPQMNGFDIAEELQGLPDLRPKLLVAVTAHGDAATKALTAKVGFDHHLAKPVTFTRLLDLMQQIET